MSEVEKYIKEYDYTEILESRFTKTLIHCPNTTCGKPIGKRQGNTWWYQQSRGGKTVETKIEMNPASGSSYKVSCTDCGYSHIFMIIEDHIKVAG